MIVPGFLFKISSFTFILIDPWSEGTLNDCPKHQHLLSTHYAPRITLIFLMDHYILSIRSLRPIDKVSLACLKSQFMNDRGVIKHSQNDSKPCARQPLVPFSQPPHQVPKVLLNPESIKHIILKEKKNATKIT